MKKRNIKQPSKSTKMIFYLNTDLDIKATKPFDNLVQYFKKAGISALHYNRERNSKGSSTWFGRFETDTPDKIPEDTIHRFIKVLEALGSVELKEWIDCETKIFNIGYDCGDRPWAFNNCLSSQLIAKIGKLGAGIEITIYPPLSRETLRLKRQGNESR